MKIAVICDTHWGVRNDSIAFSNYMKRFYAEVFFPVIDDRNIRTIIHCGDLTDRRKYINYVTARSLDQALMQPIQDREIELHLVVGNHDCYYKNTNEVNSVKQLYGSSSYPSFFFYDDQPVTQTFDGCKIMLSPWISPSNYTKSIEAFASTDAQILMGHFEIEGFEMQKGHLCQHGLDRKIFDKFDSVYSGHFHHPSSHSGITYLGAPYEMTWTDYGGVRGFHIFDTETLEMDFIENPLKMHHKISYDDFDMTIEDIDQLDVGSLKDTFIKVIVVNKTNPHIFDLFMDKLLQSGATDVRVIEDSAVLVLGESDTTIDEAQDTPTILKQYMTGVEIKHDREQAEELLLSLYQEALTL